MGPVHNKAWYPLDNGEQKRLIWKIRLFFCKNNQFQSNEIQ